MNIIILLLISVAIIGIVFLKKESNKFYNACEKVDKSIDDTFSVSELERIREYEIGSLSKLVVHHTQYSEIHRLIEKCLKKSNDILSKKLV